MNKYYRKISRTFNATYVMYLEDEEEKGKFFAGTLTKSQVIAEIYPCRPKIIQHVKIKCEMANQSFIDGSKVEVIEEKEYLN